MFPSAAVPSGNSVINLYPHASGRARAAEAHPHSPRATPAEPLTLQDRRAAQRGRGRKARAPLQIPWRGWKDIFVRTYYEILADRLLALAAGIAFYSLVALFPAIAAGVSVYALFANAATISKHLSIAADIVPAGTLDLQRLGSLPRIGARRARRSAGSPGRCKQGHPRRHYGCRFFGCGCDPASPDR
jgi:hypothetical protein